MSITEFVTRTMELKEGYEVVHLAASQRNLLDRLLLAAGVKGRYAHGSFQYTFHAGNFGYTLHNGFLTRVGEVA
jgi:hypothetical protein